MGIKPFSKKGGLNIDSSLGSTSNTRKVVRKLRVAKSKSFDILPHVEIKGEWLSPYTPPSKVPKCKIQDRKASKFSSVTRARVSSLSSTPEISSYSDSVSKINEGHSYNNQNEHTIRFDAILSPSISSSSLASLEVAQSEESIFTTEYLRSLPITKTLNLVAVLLLVLTRFLSTCGDADSYDFPSQNNDHPSSTISSSNINNKDRGLLGSAMIDSAISILSDENWERWRGLVFQSTDTISDEDLRCGKNNVIDSKSVLSMSRGGGQLNSASNMMNVASSAKPVPALSTTDPFISTSKISEMSLGDITTIFRYVVESGRSDFDHSKFISKISNAEETQQVLRAVDDAVKRSRGDGVIPAKTEKIKDLEQELNGNDYLSDLGVYGDIDALQFCAVCRVIAEWRVLRQVPPGFKGYAVGMTLGHKDVVQNVNKIESAVHKWIENQSEIVTMNQNLPQVNVTDDDKKPNREAMPRSPTLRQLLQYEIDVDFHPNSKLPRLKEKSAAMGLLWVVRQLQYQTTIFKNVISVPEVFPTAIDAVSAAYSKVYSNFHGWAVQKIFNYSFQSAPDAREIFRHMNPKYLREVEKAISRGPVFVEDPEDDVADVKCRHEQSNTRHQGLTLSSWKDNNKNPFLQILSNIGSEWKRIVNEAEKVSEEVGRNWDNFLCDIVQVFGHNRRQKMNSFKDIQGPGVSSTNEEFDNDVDTTRMTDKKSSLSGRALESYILNEMEKNARENIISFIQVAQPIIDDLEKLLEEMNMNDPTKV